MTGRYHSFAPIFALLLSLMMSATRLDAQDTSARDTSKVSDAGSIGDSSMMRIGVTIGQYYHPGDPEEFLTPDWLRVRRRHNRKTQALWKLDGRRIPDLPMSHGAGYVAARFDLQPVHGVTASLELIGEHRGISYGIFNTGNLILYPVYRIGLDTAIRIGRHRFGIQADVGHFTDLRLQEGLTMYNIDGEGVDAKLTWDRLALGLTRIGDISFGTGLNIDEVHNWTFGIEALPLFDAMMLNAHVGTYIYGHVREGFLYSNAETPRRQLINSVDPGDGGFTADLSLALDSVRFYTQGALRSAGSSGYFTSLAAFIAGLSGSFQSGSLKIAGHGEYRYYGGLFNLDYRSEEVYYRDTAQIDYGNSIGSQIYPIRYYERPFSQWAVYTEYQNLRAVNALTLYTDATWYFHDDFFCRLMIDANHLMMEGEGSHLYLFYNAGIGWEPAPGTLLMLSRTNKVMNPDKHYMTFYQTKKAMMLYTLKVAF